MRTLLALALLLPGAARAACQSGDVVLNEIVPNAPGTDTQAEWVELKNVGSGTVDLEGWTVEAGTSPTSLDVVFTLPAGTTLAPGEWLVVAGTAATLPGGIDVVTLTADKTLGNAGSNSDAVQLRDCPGDLVDVVAYGPSNNAGQEFSDESGSTIGDARLAPVPDDDESLQRLPDGADTDDGAADFGVDTPTPGVENGGGDPVVPVDCEPGTEGDVVINEFLPAPSGADEGYEWIEVYNPGSAPVDVSGWGLQSLNSGSSLDDEPEFSFPADTVLAAGAHALVAEADVDVPAGVTVFVVPAGTLKLGNSEDAARLLDCAGTPIDTVIYGGGNPDGFAADDGLVPDADGTAPDPPDDASLARRRDGLDSDDSGADFLVETMPTPGAPNRDLTCRERTRGQIKVNEFLPNPAGADSDAGTEFVELYNASDADVDISSWQVSKATSVGEDGLNETLLAMIPPDTVLAPGATWVVGGLFAEVVDQPVDGFDLGSGSDGDLVLLRDCEGDRADGALYGGDNEQQLPEDDGVVPAEGAGNPGDDQCIARKADGADTDVSVDDFVVTSFCSPGESNVREAGEGADNALPPRRGCGADLREPRESEPRVVEPRVLEGCAQGGLAGPLALWLGLAAVRRRRR